MRIKSTVLEEPVDVDIEGRFELPSRPYTTTELKKIAREINRALRDAKANQDFEQGEYE